MFDSLHAKLQFAWCGQRIFYCLHSELLLAFRVHVFLNSSLLYHSHAVLAAGDIFITQVRLPSAFARVSGFQLSNSCQISCMAGGENAAQELAAASAYYARIIPLY